MRFYLLLCLIILFSGCTKKHDSITEWQANLQKKDPRLENLLLQQNDIFFVSLNKLEHLESFAFFYKKQMIQDNSDSIETWIETYKGDEKILLNAGHAVENGIYFKQTDYFNKIVFIYRKNSTLTLNVVLNYDHNRWQLLR